MELGYYQAIYKDEVPILDPTYKALTDWLFLQ